MISRISAGSVPALSILHSSGGLQRLAIAVSESQYIYSHFNNVSGSIAPDGTRGVSIDRLKLLDSLIERLKKARATNSASTTISNDPDRLDAMIEHYSKELRSLAAKSAPFMAPAAIPTGMAVNVAA
jgi:hypothetical protein